MTGTESKARSGLMYVHFLHAARTDLPRSERGSISFSWLRQTLVWLFPLARTTVSYYFVGAVKAQGWMSSMWNEGHVSIEIEMPLLKSSGVLASDLRSKMWHPLSIRQYGSLSRACLLFFCEDTALSCAASSPSEYNVPHRVTRISGRPCRLDWPPCSPRICFQQWS